MKHAELQELFEKFGAVVDIEIPFRKKGKGVPLGLGFVKFETAESAISAFAELDKSYFQGRKLHIKPAEKKPPKDEDEEPRLKPWERDENHPEYDKQKAEKAKSSDYKQEKE